MLLGGCVVVAVVGGGGRRPQKRGARFKAPRRRARNSVAALRRLWAAMWSPPLPPQEASGSVETSSIHCAAAASARRAAELEGTFELAGRATPDQRGPLRLALCPQMPSAPPYVIYLDLSVSSSRRQVPIRVEVDGEDGLLLVPDDLQRLGLHRELLLLLPDELDLQRFPM